MADEVEQALADCRSWTALRDANSAARVLAVELDRVREVIRGYVNEVESGQRFDELVHVVPGLVSDDGTYPL